MLANWIQPQNPVSYKQGKLIHTSKLFSYFKLKLAIASLKSTLHLRILVCVTDSMTWGWGRAV